MIPHRRYTVFAGQFLITSETAAEVNEKIKLGFGY